MAAKKKSVSWSEVKTRLAAVDRAGLLSLVQDLYGASKDDQAFLHARFALGEDILKPYKVTIDRWLCPDVLKNQDTLRSEGEEGHRRLQESHRPSGRSYRANGILLRARSQF